MNRDFMGPSHDADHLNTEPTVRTVTGCADCPMIFGHYCRAELDESGNPTLLPSWAVYGNYSYPDWCPLREGDITVRLER